MSINNSDGVETSEMESDASTTVSSRNEIEFILVRAKSAKKRKVVASSSSSSNETIRMNNRYATLECNAADAPPPQRQDGRRPPLP